MNKNEHTFSVDHVNIRLSITFMLLKLVFLEIVAAMAVVLFMSVSLSEFVQDMGFTLPGISIPIYIILVTIKLFFTTIIILEWLNEYYEISPEIITHRRGIVFRYEEKYPLKDMKKIKVEQSVWGRFFNFGTITLEDAFKLEKLQLFQIHNPVRYASLLEDILPDEVESIREIRRHIFDGDVADISVK